MKILIGIMIIAVSFNPQSIFANDGFAALGVGGVTIAKTDNIAIVNEVLDIACDKIQVSYDFINESDHDEDAFIIFPLPSYPANPSETNIVSHGQPSDFTIKVNGKSINYDTEVKATLNGIDVTKDLMSAGLSMKQIAQMPFDETLLSNNELQIPKAQIEDLTKKDLVIGGTPEWDINVNYIWMQTFPSKSIVHVEHSYRPFIAHGTFGGYPGWENINKFCPSKKQIRQMDKLLANKKNLDSYNQVPGTNIKYILTTANSWKDGIRSFKLRIHPKSKDEIVTLCFPSKIYKVSDTLYEANVVNFKPKTELSIFFGNAKHCGSDAFGEPPRFR